MKMFVKKGVFRSSGWSLNSCAKAKGAFFIISMMILIAAPATFAAVVTKTNNTDNLNLTTSWVGGAVPAAADVALWDSTVTGANAVSLGANLNFNGITIANVGGAVAINSGNTLTLGASGIDMSGASQNLTINSGLTLGGGNQIWNVAGGRTLTLATGAFTRNGGALNVQGSGTVTTTMPGLTSASELNGIFPGIVVGTGSCGGNGSTSGSSFATMSGNNIVAFAPAAGNQKTGINNATGSTAASNWDINGTGATVTPSGTTLTANSIRYTDTTATGASWGPTVNNNGWKVNAVMNASAGGVLTLTRTGAGRLQPASGTNSTDEMVFNCASGDIVLSSPFVNSTAFNVTKTGPNKLTIGISAVSYTGVTTVEQGILTATQGPSAYGSTAGIVVGNVSGATLDLNGNSQIIGYLSGGGSVGGVVDNSSATAATLTVSNSVNGTFNGVIKNTGGALSLTKTGTGTQTLTGANTFSGALTLNAGQLNINSATALGTGSLNINSATSVIDNTSGGAISNANNNPIIIGTSFTNAGSYDLNLGTGNVNNGLGSKIITVSANTLTFGGAFTNFGPLTKAGNGVMVLGGANSSANLTISGGALALTGSATLNATNIAVGTNAILDLSGLSGGTLTLTD